MSKGWLIVISGPSGVGKTTVARRLCRRPGFVKLVTATTRPPRPGEVNEKDYRFWTREQFEDGIRKGELLEYATIFGNLYGTPKRVVQESLERGLRVIMDVDSQGARSIRATGLNAFFVFIAPPNLEELRRRLEKRNTENSEILRRRLEGAEAEMAHSTAYDAVITNRTVDQTVEEIETALRHRNIL